MSSRFLQIVSVALRFFHFLYDSSFRILLHSFWFCHSGSLDFFGILSYFCWGFWMLPDCFRFFQRHTSSGIFKMLSNFLLLIRSLQILTDPFRLFQIPPDPFQIFQDSSRFSQSYTDSLSFSQIPSDFFWPFQFL